MALYSYTKSGHKIETQESEVWREDSYANLEPKKRTTIWSVGSNIYSSIKHLANASTLANILVPSVFIVLGFVFIYQQFFPEVKQMITQKAGYLSQGTLAPVQDEYFNLSQYVSQPSGTAELTFNAINQHILEDDSISLTYSGTFYISIPALGMNRLPVTANVDSTSEETYEKALNTALAHFKSTSLPLSNVNNNSVIYGHSASPNYGPKPSDPYVGFSFLPDLKVGDDIIIEMNGTTYKYKMYKSKIVDPSDTSIITGTKGKKTLTLFTCYPLGSNAQRYVAIARPV